LTPREPSDHQDRWQHVQQGSARHQEHDLPDQESVPVSKLLRFTKTELANAAKVAKAHGVSVKLGTDGSIFVYPNGGPVNEGDEIDREFAEWEAKHGYSAVKGAG
jgi:hypothetical protein